MISRLEVVEMIDSTTAELLRRPSSQAAPGTALLALRQQAGKGRSERAWISPLGGMYLSLVVEVDKPQGLALLGAKALLDLVSGFGVKAKLRWPNDVMVSGRKLGGVLPVVRYAGNRLERAVLGVGLNVCPEVSHFPDDLEFTTLASERPEVAWSVPDVARRYLAKFETHLNILSSQGLACFVEHCQSDLEGTDPGRIPILVEPGVAPRRLAPIVGLDHDGALRLSDGTRLESLGREQRLRFADEARPTSPH